MRPLGLFLLLLLIPSLAVVVTGLAQPDSNARPDSATVALHRVADGQSDATLVLQRVLDGGGRIELPRGVYRISRPLVVDLNRAGYTSISGHGTARIEMHGAGPALRIIGTHFRSADPSGFSEAVWQRERMPLIDGLAIEGHHAESIGIEAAGTMQLTLTRLQLRGLLHGIRLAENNRNIAISDCHIYHNRGAGVYYDQVNLHQSNIANCHISYNAGGGIVCRGGNVRNVHITGCDLESNMAADAPPAANILIDCTDSRAGTAEVAITGCTIQHTRDAPDSANIRIFGRSSADGEPPVHWGNVTITGNVLSDVQTNIHLRECRGVTVTGNTLWEGYQHNLLIEDCSHVVITGNVLDRNPPYDRSSNPKAKNTVVVRGAVDCTITGLHLAEARGGEAGMLLENCRRINLAQCTLLDCEGAELLLRSVHNSRVSDCLLRDDRPGQHAPALVLEQCTNVQDSDNQVHPAESPAQ